MTASTDIARLVTDATASLKADWKGAVASLESAFEQARAANLATDAAMVAEELARAFSRKKHYARSLHFARKGVKLAPERKAAWAMLGKTCELVALRTPTPAKALRAKALYRGTAAAFKKAASLTSDPEDKRWLLELAGDAARQAK